MLWQNRAAPWVTAQASKVVDRGAREAEAGGRRVRDRRL
jgi:hypothetical protein